MSDKTLLRFLERLNTDSAFLENAVANPEGAFAAFGLTASEQAAIRAGDEDALRRMTGMDVAGYMLGSSSSSIIYTAGPPPRPRPTDTPGSGNGCGTGSTHNCFAPAFGQ